MTKRQYDTQLRQLKHEIELQKLQNLNHEITIGRKDKKIEELKGDFERSQKKHKFIDLALGAVVLIESVVLVLERLL